jgi:glutathione reductase (NADPH)
MFINRTTRSKILFNTFIKRQCSSSSSSQHFDLLVIGGGSGTSSSSTSRFLRRLKHHITTGGISSARRAASHGAKVGVIERNTQLGGTCVNVGCVPKKVMFNAATTAEMAHEASNFGFEDIPKKPKFNWGKLKERRDAYVHRLNGIYERNLENSGVERILGDASFLSSRKVQVNGTEYTADHVLIATGGYPTIPDCPGASFGVTSDGFFDIDSLPERSLVVGAGYIAVELAGILNALGSETTLVVSLFFLSSLLSLPHKHTYTNT